MENLQKPVFQDKQLTCIDCEQEFQFTKGEQDYFWNKNLVEPKRCLKCRKIRKLTITPNTGVRDG